MKKLGLIGGTGPESTVEYYRQIEYGVQEKAGCFPNLVIESLSVFDVLRFCGEGDYQGLAVYLLKGFHRSRHRSAGALHRV
jgi:aspartate racemase